MSIHIFFSLFIFSACQSELPELSRAKEQHAQGAKLEALQMYEDIIKRYPQHPSSTEAKVLLEDMYFEAAKIASKDNPLSAYRIVQRQLQKFPNGTKSKEAKVFLEKIQPSALAFQVKQKEEEDLCKKAQSSQNVVDWRAYITRYPTGSCIRQARDEIRELDKKSCIEAREGSPVLWQNYIENFPQGSCLKEAQEKSVRKDMSNDDRLIMKIYIRECSRLAEKCPKLHERFNELIQKNETDYLRGSFYAYLKNWLSAYNDTSSQMKADLSRLNEEGFDTSIFQDEYNQICVQACAQNQKDLADLKSCVLAFDAQNSEQWKKYLEDHPKGACTAIARP